MHDIASTPAPPYYAVIFTSIRQGENQDYHKMAEKMLALASQQPGYLGVESVSAQVGITVSYWQDLESIAAWKSNASHRIAQESGRTLWYSAYKTRICLVQRDYEFSKS